MGVSYYLTGPDGSGKTTLLREIEKHLNDSGINTNHIWIRSPKILSKPLMLYCRLIGLTKYKTVDGTRYGKHMFYKSRIVSWIFPILQLIDFKIKWFIVNNSTRKESTKLFDRFSLDTLADLMVDTKRYNLHTTIIGQSFIKLIPKESVILGLFTDEETIRTRKKDTLHDEMLTEKIKVYSLLSEALNLDVIDNNRDFEIVKNEVLNNCTAV